MIIEDAKYIHRIETKIVPASRPPNPKPLNTTQHAPQSINPLLNPTNPLIRIPKRPHLNPHNHLLKLKALPPILRPNLRNSLPPTLQIIINLRLPSPTRRLQTRTLEPTPPIARHRPMKRKAVLRRTTRKTETAVASGGSAGCECGVAVFSEAGVVSLFEGVGEVCWDWGWGDAGGRGGGAADVGFEDAF